MREIIIGIIFIVIICLIIVGCVSTVKEASVTEKTLPDVDIFGDYKLPGEFHVFIAFGQSNMQGPGAIRAEDREGVSERFRSMNVVSGRYAGGQRDKHKLYRASPPNIITDNNLVNYLGLNIGLSPVDYFGRTLIEKIPQNITIGVIAVANGDMALAAFHKTKAEDYYRSKGTLSGRPSQTEMQGMSRYKGAGYENIYEAIVLNAKIAQKAGGIIKGIIVHQGESGAGIVNIDWDELLKEIYDDMLADLGLAPNSIPIILGQTWNGGSGSTGGALSSESRIQSLIPNAWIVSSIGATGRSGQGQPDNIHFGSAGIQLLGTRYGEKMFELIYK